MIKKAAERFWSKVWIRHPNECWPWMAALDDKGYGAFKYAGHMHKASRISYQLKQRLKRDLDVLHTCDNPRCVNPKHLYAGTAKDNMRDCVKRGRHPRQRHNRDKKLAERGGFEPPIRV